MTTFAFLGLAYCQKLGGHIRKGEKATPIWFWKPWTIKDPEKEAEEPADELADEVSSSERTIPILRRYRVFNVEQCEGLEGRIPDLSADRRC